MINKPMNKKWLRALGIFAVVGVLLTIVLRLITPPSPEIPKTDFVFTNQTSGTTTFANIRFTGDFTPPTSSLPIASIQASQTTLDYVRDSLIEQYELQQVVGISGLWQGPEYTLTYNEYLDDFKFYYWPDLHDSELPLTNPSQKIEAAQQFVNQYFPNLGLVAQKDSVSYFEGHQEYFAEVNPAEATEMKIRFTQTIEGIPVYLAHERSTIVEVTINEESRIIGVTFQPYFVSFSPSEQQVSIVSLESALENINNHSEAAIVYAYGEETGDFTIEQIQSGELKTVDLQYRADLEAGLAYPFYHFVGELSNAAGQTIQAEIITPAVQTQ